MTNDNASSSIIVPDDKVFGTRCFSVLMTKMESGTTADADDGGDEDDSWPISGPSLPQPFIIPLTDVEMNYRKNELKLIYGLLDLDNDTRNMDLFKEHWFSERGYHPCGFVARGLDQRGSPGTIIQALVPAG